MRRWLPRIKTRGASARFRRPEERSVWLLLVAIAAGVTWIVAQQLGWPMVTRIVVASIAAVVALLVPELRLRRADSDRATQLLGRLNPPLRDDDLPLVHELRPQDLRVHEPILTVPYVPRDVAGSVDDAIRSATPLLLVGHSMAGKTRLAMEQLLVTLPNAKLLAPVSAKALRNLIDAGLVLDGVVVWLDNLDRFLKGDDALDLSLLNTLITVRAVVVATIRRNERSSYRPTDISHPPQWEVIRRFKQVRLRRRLTVSEQDRARRLITDQVVLAAIDRYGLAEYLGGGPLALDRFDDGETDNPVGYAFVRIAIDWRRAGLARLVPHSVFVEALPAYLRDRPELRTDNAAIEEGLAWATKRINETVALLTSYEIGSNPDGKSALYEAFDYLVDVVSNRDDTAIPADMWRQVIKTASLAEKVDVQQVAGRFFVGRHTVMAELAAWLTSPTSGGPGVLTVTGTSGTGKTAVLTRLALLADPSTREIIGAVPVTGPRPAIPKFDLVTTAAGKTLGDLTEELSEAAGFSSRQGLGPLLRKLADRIEPFRVIIDAVDAAIEPDEVKLHWRAL